MPVLTGQAIAMAFVLTVPTGTVTATGQAATPAKTIVVPAGSATFQGNNPSIGGLVGINAVVGAMTLTGTTPTVVLTGQSQGNVFLVMGGSAALTISGVTPSPSTSRFQYPLVGSLSLDGQYLGVQFKSPDSGTLTFTGPAPTLQFAARTATPPPGALALTGRTPALAFIYPAGAGALGLTGQPPQLLLSGAVSPSSGILTLNGTVPTLYTAVARAVPVGTLTLTGQPILIRTVAPDTGALTLAGVVPTLRYDLKSFPATGALSLIGVAPFTIVVPVVGDVAENLGGGVLTLSGPAPTAAVTLPRWTSGVPRRVPGHHPLGRRR